MNAPRYDFMTKALAERRQGHSLRSLQEVTPLDGPYVMVDGRRLINFSSNDYLGLAKHHQLIERAIEFTRKYGAGSTASRLVCGNAPFFAAVEQKLAALKGTESALLFNAGFQANVSMLAALADRHTLILADRLCHSSIIQGCRLSRAKLVRFRHNDPLHLEELLEAQPKDGGRILIITESVFSMDGDCADLDACIRIARKHEALLIVDEAHATGVAGPAGMGLGCGKDIDVLMGTFGKACGGFGAYIACSRLIRDYMINFCAGFIYTTALPPAVLGAIDAALDLVPGMDAERAHLHGLAERLRTGLAGQGFDTGGSASQIVPVIIGAEPATLAMSRHLEAKGILAVPIRPPTVESGQARIRLTLSALHTQDQIDGLIDAFRNCHA